ncbi:unnamed protein product [Spirodela intermedia]|uniref:Uncharacterized protein n=1 Tax=Spirodela intermedia TaxID=51605 RepID=A0A7I8KL37_SPIIN|nr:unnamed protein product [Spirodela intermedia]
MCLRDHSVPLQYRPINKINAPIEINTNFRVDHHLRQMLPHFHGMTHEIYEISHYLNILIEIVKIRLFSFTLKDKAKDWLQAVAQESDKHLGKRIEVEMEALEEVISTKNKDKKKEVKLNISKSLRNPNHSENLCMIDIIDECVDELFGREISCADVQQRLNPKMLEVIKVEIVK